jgi:hypothetical protein
MELSPIQRFDQEIPFQTKSVVRWFLCAVHRFCRRFVQTTSTSAEGVHVISVGRRRGRSIYTVDIARWMQDRGRCGAAKRADGEGVLWAALGNQQKRQKERSAVLPGVRGDLE